MAKWTKVGMQHDWLPVDEILPELLAGLQREPSAVLRAPTGAGKTTRVAPYLLDAGLAFGGRIILVEPRRVAARAAAGRMAQERGSALGGQFGYHVRFERKYGPETRVVVVTEGVLLRKLLDDPFLTEADLVIFDEFHERRLDSDLLLGMLRLLQQTVRPQLRLLVMSATLEVDPVARYLAPCPILQSEGRLYPVDVQYQPRAVSEPWPAAITRAAARLLDDTPGDVLVFVPGLREIRQTISQLEQHLVGQALQIVPLYGDLPADQQDAALRQGPTRRIIVATNVAETSVTVEGVTGIIDTGLVRQQQFDPRTGLDRLDIVPISQASADQRAGRAGRLAPGVCIRLWDLTSQRQRAAETEPEIRRVDLAGALLHVKSWIEPQLEHFPWYESPRAESVEQALAVLTRLGALDEDRITPLGRELAEYPIHPRLGRMLIEGKRLGVARRAALAAALLSERSPFATQDRAGRRRDGGGGLSRSDVLDQVESLEAFEQRRTGPDAPTALHSAAARGILRARDQLLRLADRNSTSRPALSPTPLSPPALSTSADDGLLRALVAAFPDRVAKRREPHGRRALMVGGRGVVLAAGSTVLESPLLLCVDVDAGGSESLVRMAAEVQREWLPPHLLTTTVELEFDVESERVAARRRVRYLDLVLEEHPAALPDEGQVAAALAAAAREHLPRVLPPAGSDAERWITRVRWLRTWMPELDLPAYEPAELAAALDWLCLGRRGFDQLRAGPWLAALQQQLAPQQRHAVEREAPERLVVPSGSRIALTYERDRPPVLAVRIQELFGLRESPRVAAGRVRVLLHLLGPNFRPVQVTDDLTSFWQNTYPRVRQELRRRYPKHAWPDDPLAAPPQRGAKRTGGHR